MSWTNAVITDAGHRLQAALLGTGKGLVFTRAVTGAGLAEGELAAQTAVTEERQTLSLQPATPLEDAKTKVQVLLSNAGLETGYTMHQLGFYAKAQDEEDEILYALVQDETGDVIPADAESPGFTADWSYVFAYSNADSVTVTVDPAGMITWDKVGAAGGVAPLGPEEHLPETDAFTNDEILDEETATDIGLGPGAVPADLFDILAHVGDVHVWRRTVTLSQPGYSLSSEKSDGTLANGDSPGYTNVRLDYGDSITVSPNGDITINNKTSTTVSATGSAINVTNKFIHIIDYNGNGSGNPEYANSDFPIGTILFVTGSMVISGSRIYVTKYKTVTSYKAGTTIDYPISINRNAYQEGSDAKPGKVVKGAIETGQITLVDGANGKYVRLEYATSVTVDDKANIIFSSPENANITYGTSDSEVQAILRGKYMRVLSIDENPGNPTLSDFQIGKVYFIPSDTTSTTDSQHGIVYLNKRQSVTAVAAIPAGTTIEYLGNLGDKSRVQYTSYVGTGAFGASSPNSLTFRFAPKVVLFESGSHPEYSFSGYVVGPYVYGAKAFLVSKGSVSGINAVTVSGNTIKWSGEDADRQLNRAGLKYYVVAIG